MKNGFKENLKLYGIVIKILCKLKTNDEGMKSVH